MELKAVEALVAFFTMQTLSYLKAMALPPGVLINFNVELMKTGLRRIINSRAV